MFRAAIMALVVTGICGEATARAQAHDTHVVSLPVAVDGALNPEAIPEDLAYRHFLMVVAEPDTPTSGQVARRDAILDRIGLSAADRVAIISALAGLRGRLDGLDGEAQRLVSTNTLQADRHDAIRAEKTRALDEARLSVVQSLTLIGRTQLQRHVLDHVRRRIVIYRQ
jgi:hypothetical protein